MIDKQMRHRRGRTASFHGDAYLTKLSDVQWKPDNVVAHGAENQIVDNAHAQSALHHCQQSYVSRYLVCGFGTGGEVIQKSVNLIILKFLELYETFKR